MSTYSLHHIEKLLIKVNSCLSLTYYDNTDKLLTQCPNIIFNPGANNFQIVGDIDTTEAADFLYPLLANFKELPYAADVEKFMKQELIPSFQRHTKIINEWGSIEKYHHHEIHSFP